MAGKKVLVVTDSSASLPQQLVRELDIRVIPLWLIWGDQCYLDGVDIDPPTFYNRLRSSSSLPTSTQPSSVEFRDLFLELAPECSGIVCVLASSRISGTVESAQAAKELVDLPVEIVDSGFSAMGQGLIAAAAAREAASGAAPSAVAEMAETVREKTRLLFVVDTLEFLHKGGRIGGAKRLLGTALNIKPILHFEDGMIQPLTQARTKRKALAQLLQQVELDLAGLPLEEAGIVHVDCLEEGQRLQEMVWERFRPARIHISDVSPVVGTHVGPGALGLAYYSGQAG